MTVKNGKKKWEEKKCEHDLEVKQLKEEVGSSRVNIRLNPKKIATKRFIVLNALTGHGEFQKKSLG